MVCVAKGSCQGRAATRDELCRQVLNLNERPSASEMQLVKAARPRVWQPRWWNERLMAWVMDQPSLRLQAFRFIDVLPSDPLAQNEFFGPLLAVLRVPDLDEAFRVANGTEYALTGGIFSRSPSSLERARSELNVGNLYLNREITGAMVGRHPFGGHRFSGIGSKAGGSDYLGQFVIPVHVAENTLRQGFAID